MADFQDDGRPNKRPRLSSTVSDTSPEAEDKLAWTWPDDLKPIDAGTISPPSLTRKSEKNVSTGPILETSPFQLTNIPDLSESYNVDTVTLKDILNDPLIKENWQFNFLFDVDFVMSHLDGDVRDTIKTKIVHGFHDKNGAPRLNLEAAAKQHPNVQSIPTYVPNYGTHHSKMMVLIRHDDTVQVIIHTANMIARDWTNMTQVMWRSPLLPLLITEQQGDGNSSAPIGSGQRFKQEFLNYLGAYKDKYNDPLRSLIDQLKCYDFSAIKAALVASVPGKQIVTGSSRSNNKESLWGWPGLKRVLSEIPASAPASKAQINVQISSIGTAPEKWLEGFWDVLRTAATGKEIQSAPKKAAIKVIFPTADEIRRSLDGYNSGSSIHMKLDSQAQKAQLQYMRPLFCTWAGDNSPTTGTIREAGRRRAAPHIKTFTKFIDSACDRIDWVMVTSANLSKQAWGEMANKAGEVTTRSYEIGVVVCPPWLAVERKKAVMVPVFKKDSPDVSDGTVDVDKVVGVRMPYDLPLVPYAEDEEPWCAERTHLEPDWKGSVWQTYTPTV